MLGRAAAAATFLRSASPSSSALAMLGSAAAVFRGGKTVESRRINKGSDQEKKTKKSREEKREKRIAEGAEGEGGKTNPGDSGIILNLSGSSNLLRQRKKSRNLALSRLRLLSFYEDIIAVSYTHLTLPTIYSV